MHRQLLPLALAAACAVSPPALAAQAPNSVPASSSPIVRVPGKTIELVGLTRWTPSMIQDSMDVYSPGDSLTSHACGAVLRHRLGFANAAVLAMRDAGSEYLLVPVIEPQDSALVRHPMLPRDTTASRAPWPELVSLAKAGPNVLEPAIRERIRARGAGQAAAMPAGIGTDSAVVRRLWAGLDRHHSARDAAVARQLVRSSPNLYDRIAAVMILSSFDRDDRTWWALVAALLESETVTNGVASEVLVAFAHTAPRRVDWRPAAADLHMVLNGANLWSLDDILTVLVATGVGPDLARPLLRGGGHAVLMYAGAAHPRFREPARRFLRAVSGRDYGDDLAAWQAWIARL